MQLYRVVNLGLLFVFLRPVQAQEKVVRELQSLQTRFESAVKTDIDQPFQQGLAELNSQYARALDLALGEAQKNGKLEEALRIKTEQLRVTSGQQMPLNDETDLSDNLRRLRQTYRKSLSLIANRRDAPLAVLGKAYAKELNELIVGLTKQGRLEDAVAVRERLKTLPSAIPNSPQFATGEAAVGTVAPSDKLTPDQAQIVNGLRIGKIELPARRGLTYFAIDSTIENRTPQAVIEKRISVDVRVLCVDGDGKSNVIAYSDQINIAQKGRQLFHFGGGVQVQSVKLRNNNDEIPKNAHAAFKIDGTVFREEFLTNRGEEKWWLRDDLIKAAP